MVSDATFSELGKAEQSRRDRIATLECKHRCYLLLTNLVYALGIAQGSSALQADADLSQLNVRTNFGGTERTRTVIVFIDSEVHKPFCHDPTAVVSGQLSVISGLVSRPIRSLNFWRLPPGNWPLTTAIWVDRPELNRQRPHSQ